MSLTSQLHDGELGRWCAARLRDRGGCRVGGQGWCRTSADRPAGQVSRTTGPPLAARRRAAGTAVHTHRPITPLGWPGVAS